VKLETVKRVSSSWHGIGMVSNSGESIFRSLIAADHYYRASNTHAHTHTHTHTNRFI